MILTPVMSLLCGLTGLLAWLFGTPIISWDVDQAFKMPALWQSVLVMAGMLFAAGAVVGAVHGWFLVRLADRNP